jgi:hypothetical protein
MNSEEENPDLMKANAILRRQSTERRRLTEAEQAEVVASLDRGYARMLKRSEAGEE